MKRLLILSLVALVAPSPLWAGQAEAKELARNYNCKVASIAEDSVATGSAESITYKVNCTLPASASEEDRKANGTLWVRCEMGMCQLLKKGE